jgi:hypothetical protein
LPYLHNPGPSLSNHYYKLQASGEPVSIKHKPDKVLLLTTHQEPKDGAWKGELALGKHGRKQGWEKETL